MIRGLSSRSSSTTDNGDPKTVQTLLRADTFASPNDCFTADLAVLIEDEPPREATPTRFIDLVEHVRNVLGMASVGNLQDASEDLDSALAYLTDALTSPDGDQSSLLA